MNTTSKSGSWFGIVKTITDFNRIYLHGILLALGLSCATCLKAAEVMQADVCVFGGTSGGIIAAVQTARLGKSVILLEPGKHLGGLSTGGLGATDIGNKAAIGGLSRQFYKRLGRHYGRDEAWTFEPHVAEQTFLDLLKENGVRFLKEQRLTRVQKRNGQIREIRLESGLACRARMYIDATYEGDLMAKAGVAFTIGREANAQYGETLNGIRPQTPYHQFTVAVDPYVKSGDPASGLLPFIQPAKAGRAGEGDRAVQAYNYRLCFTTNAANRLPLAAPAGFDAARYELLARYLEALVAAGKKPKLADFWHPIWVVPGKTDINNNGGFSTDFIGMNYDYPAASYATRERIAKAHENYIRGFIWFLATNPRVPENIRQEMNAFGPCKDEFPATGGWPYALYVREARRMVSDYVMTEHHCRGQEVAQDPVGLAAYNMDSHNCRRIVKNGRVENEGDVQVPPMAPYPISYRSIIPKANECGNLLVPVCLSSSHIAYGSIRMEPVFMILGQSAATAAVLAMENQVPVQKLAYETLRARLLADQQILEWKSAAAK